MTNLRVEWTFCTPVMVPNDPIHLDALLAFALVQDAMANGDEDCFAAQERLPLDREGEVWKASMLMFEPTAEPFVVPYTRRFFGTDLAADIEHVATSKNVIPSSMGVYKAFDLRMTAQWMKKATAWCVGDEQQVRELLNRVPTVGKWTRNGYGSVAEVTVTRCDNKEAERWRIRVLPDGQGLEYKGLTYGKGMRTVKPPYWDKRQLVEARIPLV